MVDGPPKQQVGPVIFDLRFAIWGENKTIGTGGNGENREPGESVNREWMRMGIACQWSAKRKLSDPETQAEAPLALRHSELVHGQCSIPQQPSPDTADMDAAY